MLKPQTRLIAGLAVEGMDMIRILSFGGGVDSSSILLMHINSMAWTGRPHPKIGPIDRVVFSDTGAESKATYNNIEQFKQLCDQHSIPFDVVAREGENIFEWQQRLGNLPVMRQGSHVCSLKFKGEVIQKHIKAQYGDAPVMYIIGIEANETRRAGKFTKPKGDVAEYYYPLIQMGWDRNDCEDYLAIAYQDGTLKHKVEKSSCVFCPFMSKDEIIDMRDNNPAGWAMVRMVEHKFRETSPKRHQAWIDAGKPLNKGGKAPKGMWSMDSWAEGARLFINKVNGVRLSVDEWENLKT